MNENFSNFTLFDCDLYYSLLFLICGQIYPELMRYFGSVFRMPIMRRDIFINISRVACRYKNTDLK